MVIKLDLIILYKCYRHENTSKESQKYICDNFWCVRPLPADSGHILHQQNSQKSWKMSKIAIFQKSIFFYIVAGNMIFCQKLALWTLETTQKPYIDPSTTYDCNWEKMKKIVFFTSKIKVKNFSKSIFLADEVRPPNQYWGSIHPIGAPKTPLSCCIGRTPSYWNLALKIPKYSKKRYFFTKVLFLLLLLRFECC